MFRWMKLNMWRPCGTLNCLGNMVCCVILVIGGNSGVIVIFGSVKICTDSRRNLQKTLSLSQSTNLISKLYLRLVNFRQILEYLSGCVQTLHGVLNMGSDATAIMRQNRNDFLRWCLVFARVQ